MNYKLENIPHSIFIQTLNQYLNEIENLLGAEHLCIIIQWLFPNTKLKCN